MAENNQNKEKKMRPQLVALAVGDSIVFPIEKLKSLRTQASELGAILNRHFTTVTDRQARTITIIRKE